MTFSLSCTTHDQIMHGEFVLGTNDAPGQWGKHCVLMKHWGFRKKLRVGPPFVPTDPNIHGGVSDG